MHRIFMTGGAGFLGRAILRHYRTRDPSVRFTIYSRDEAKHARVRAEFPEHSYILGDVRDADRVEIAMAGHDTVIHAAAMKYVPQGESDVHEAIGVNVDGTRNVIVAAVKNGVERVVGISTDKACQPENVYGITKRLMERMFQEAAFWSTTHFNTVRYGNVIASTGSVIPLFREQARRGVITITHEKMTRFWLTVEHAVELIEKTLQLNETERGAILIPRLPACEIATLAQAAIRIEHPKGRSPAVRIEQIGLRPGEKVHEELLSTSEAYYTRRFDNLMILYPPTSQPTGEGSELYYTSATPDHFIHFDELVKLISEVKE